MSELADFTCAGGGDEDEVRLDGFVLGSEVGDDLLEVGFVSEG